MPIFNYNRKEATKRFGHLSQIGGLKPYVLSDGRAAGIKAVDFRTTRGLEFTVLLDRGIDISEARYRGMSLCWRSASGDVAPAFYDPRNLEWLRTFFGGLLATCGLTNAGRPCVDGPEEMGLHGRIGAMAGEKVCLSERWEGDDLVMEVSGMVREGSLFGYHLELYRTITSRADSAALKVRDKIVNVGARKSPCMVLYHINLGFPLLDDGVEFYLPTVGVRPFAPEADEGLEGCRNIFPPVYGIKEKTYLHTIKPGADGYVNVALVNRRLAGGLGLRLRYLHSELPCFTQWKMLGEREFVLGVEPGNCYPLGRVVEREEGRLVELEVGEEYNAGFEINVYEGAAEIDKLVKQVGGE